MNTEETAFNARETVGMNHNGGESKWGWITVGVNQSGGELSVYFHTLAAMQSIHLYNPKKRFNLKLDAALQKVKPFRFRGSFCLSYSFFERGVAWLISKNISFKTFSIHFLTPCNYVLPAIFLTDKSLSLQQREESEFHFSKWPSSDWPYLKLVELQRLTSGVTAQIFEKSHCANVQYTCKRSGIGEGLIWKKKHMYKTTYLPREFDFAAPTGDYYLYSKYYIFYMFIRCIA